MIDVESFLCALYRGVEVECYLELRPAAAPSVFLPLDGGGPMMWLKPWADLEKHMARLEAHAKWQPFFGVAPRIEPTHGRADNCACITAVVADIDFKRIGEEAAAEAIAAHPFSPSIVVNTGGGFHCYWLLTEPLFDTERAVRLLSAWGATVPESDAVFDLPRVLRLPGSLNRKYDPPRRAVIEVFEPERRYTVEELEEEAAKVAPEVAHEGGGVSLLASAGGSKLPGQFDEGDRHAALFKMMRSAVARYALTFEEVMPLMEAVNQRRCDPPVPAGDLRAFLRRAYETPHSSAFSK